MKSSINFKSFRSHVIERELAYFTIVNFLREDGHLMRMQSTAFAERMSEIFGFTIGTARKHVSRAVKLGLLKRTYYLGTYWIELRIYNPVKPDSENRNDETVLA